MKYLLKYEFRRARLALLGITAITLFLEMVYLLGYLLDINALFTLGLFGGILVIACSTMAILLYGVFMFNEDISKKPGYLLFSTPRSHAQILASKLLMILFALIGTSILFTLCIGFDIFLAIQKEDMSLLSFFAFFDPSITKNAVLGTIFNLPNYIGMGMYVLSTIAEFLMQVMVAYLLIVLTKTMMGNQKGRGILGVILWIVITNVISSIGGFISTALLSLSEQDSSFSNSIDALNGIMEMLFSPVMYLPSMLISIGCCIGGFCITKWMMDKKLSL